MKPMSISAPPIRVGASKMATEVVERAMPTSASATPARSATSPPYSATSLEREHPTTMRKKPRTALTRMRSSVTTPPLSGHGGPGADARAGCPSGGAARAAGRHWIAPARAQPLPMQSWRWGRIPRSSRDDASGAWPCSPPSLRPGSCLLAYYSSIVWRQTANEGRTGREPSAPRSWRGDQRRGVTSSWTQPSLPQSPSPWSRSRSAHAPWPASGFQERCAPTRRTAASSRRHRPH